MSNKIATVAAAVAMVFIPATGAQAATVPAGESFYGFAWSGQLFHIDPTSGDSTGLFTIADAAESAAADYNPVDGLIYALAPYQGCSLVVVDPQDETSTTIELTIDEGTNESCRAMAITEDGTIYASLDDANVYVIDGETGAATRVGGVGEVGAIVGMAYNDLTNVLYAAADEDGIFVINTQTGAGSEVGLNDYVLNGAWDFDSDGVLWFTDWDEIFSVSDLEAFTPDVEGTMQLDPNDEGTEAGFFAPAGIGADPSDLADTGTDAATIFGFAAFAVVAGAVVSRLRRRA